MKLECSEIKMKHAVDCYFVCLLIQWKEALYCDQQLVGPAVLEILVEMFLYH